MQAAMSHPYRQAPPDGAAHSRNVSTQAGTAVTQVAGRWSALVKQCVLVVEDKACSMTDTQRLPSCMLCWFMFCRRQHH